MSGGVHPQDGEFRMPGLGSGPVPHVHEATPDRLGSCPCDATALPGGASEVRLRPLCSLAPTGIAIAAAAAERAPRR
ncbi:hypothetical protein GCM10023147_29660 [Tsukamurella soli]|uniref:Uncharacterized protein n=1 Tax=Tsukamurella soli TaxID=644556 RepID=A0ABP8JUH6_9ACTN